MGKLQTHRLSSIEGDSNNLEGLGFHDVKLSKVCDRGVSPEGREVLHQAVDESLVYRQEFRCSKKGHCILEDAQSVTGFGG